MPPRSDSGGFWGGLLGLGGGGDGRDGRDGTRGPPTEFSLAELKRAHAVLQVGLMVVCVLDVCVTN